MGAHHYKLDLIPRSAAHADAGAHDWDEQPSAELLAGLRALLPSNKSWDDVEEFESSLAWGSDLRIWHDDSISGPVRSIEFRFAPAGDGFALLERFLVLAAAHNLVVRSVRTSKVLEPKAEEVTADLKLTPAFKFLSDPSAAVIDAARGVIDPQK
jgi:hypothetical protein